MLYRRRGQVVSGSAISSLRVLLFPVLPFSRGGGVSWHGIGLVITFHVGLRVHACVILLKKAPLFVKSLCLFWCLGGDHGVIFFEKSWF